MDVTTTGRSAILRPVARTSARVLVRIVFGGALVLFASVSIGPRVLPYRTATVLSGSMRPALPVGSVVFERPVASSRLRVGDIITFHPPGPSSELVTHRIARIVTDAHGTYFLTKGDANGVADGWRIRAAGTGYREVAAVPYMGYLLVWSSAAAVRLVLLAALAGALLVSCFRRIWRRHPAPERV